MNWRELHDTVAHCADIELLEMYRTRHDAKKLPAAQQLTVRELSIHRKHSTLTELMLISDSH